MLINKDRCWKKLYIILVNTVILFIENYWKKCLKDWYLYLCELKLCRNLKKFVFKLLSVTILDNIHICF